MLFSDTYLELTMNTVTLCCLIFTEHIIPQGYSVNSRHKIIDNALLIQREITLSLKIIRYLSSL